MGTILSKPVLEKKSFLQKDERVVCGSSSMQGWRFNMEDVHTVLPRLMCVPEDKHMSFFAVYDGHGGAASALYSGAMLHLKITSEKEFAEGNYVEAIRKGFLSTDSELHRCISSSYDQSGCTAVMALITEDWRLFVGNAGDSRAVISWGGIAVALSDDHKPTNREENRRIIDGGGYVENNRVNGNLALSRAMGDFRFKDNPNTCPERQVVTANPDVTERMLGDDDEFIVVACDGIWDCMSNQEVVSFVRERILQGLSLERICERIMDHCVADSAENCEHGHDNMTIIIIGLLNHKTEDEWRQTVRKHTAPTIALSANVVPAEDHGALQDLGLECRAETEGTDVILPESNTNFAGRSHTVAATPSAHIDRVI